MNYRKEFKDAILRRILPPNNESIATIAREKGLSEQTLRNWRDKARKAGYAAPGTDAVPDEWNTQDKFLVVIETASLNETELAEYARKKGLYVEQSQNHQLRWWFVIAPLGQIVIPPKGGLANRSSCY